MSTTMAKTTTASSPNPAEKMTAPSITLLPEKKSPTNVHSSPAQSGKTTPSNTEKKPQINGYASPSHAQTNSNNKAIVEGYMKTDDRVRLAKERREERERSLAAREQMLKEKDRRARLQYERTMEERCRRLEEQRLREEQRRAAVEEKRRQQLEEERERLEALMKRSLERSLQLEQRSRRWGRGYPGAGDCENASLPSAASAFPHGIASPIPAVSESAPCSPHRSPYRADHSRVVLQGGSQSTPNTPKKQRLRKYRNASPGYGSPLRRSESPATVTHTTSPTPKIVSRMHTHSPNRLHPNQNSPSRNPSNLPSKAEDKPTKVSKTDSPQRKAQTERNSVDPKTKGGPPQTIKVNMIEKYHSPERRSQGATPHVYIQEGDKKKDTTLSTSSGKIAAGTKNEEEATRLLAERRRLARALKEHEEKKRAEAEEAKLKEEQLKKPIAQLQEAKVETHKEEITKVANLVPKNENTEKQANGENVQLNQNGKEEKAKALTPEEARRQQQERDLQKQQEEEERQLRKKRIEEIMKRTRKGEGDLKLEESAGADTGETSVTVDGKVKEQSDKKEVEVQSKSESKPVVDTVMVKQGLTAPNKENPQSVRTVYATIPKGDTQKPEETEQSQDSKNSIPKKDMDQSNQCNANVKIAIQIKKESTKTVEREGSRELVNGAVKSESLKSTITKANRLQTLFVSKTETKSVSQDRVTKPSVTPQSLGLLTLPVIKLAPLEVSGTGSGDEVQSMEVSPVSKEELISIPEFSPVSDTLNSALNNSKALEDLMDLTGSVTYPRLSPHNPIGDCNQNLIHGVVSPVSDSKLVGKSPPSPNKLTVK